MTTLTQQQTELIKHEIAQRGISHPDLGEDLLDHICTAVETEMAAGRDFNLAYQMVMSRFGKQELKQVEKKTRTLLNGQSIFYPNILQSFILLLVYIFFIFFSGFIISPIQKGAPDFFYEHIILIQAIQVCGALFLVILIARVMLKEENFTKVDIFPLRPFPPSIFPLILGILFLWLIWMEAVFTLIPLSESYQALIFHHLNFFKPLPAIVCIGILWPILSEILFRGIILKGLLRKYKPSGAIMCASIFYSVSLLNLYGVPSLFLMGLFSGWLFYRTHSLIPSIMVVIFAQLPGLLHIMLAKPQHINQLLIWKNLVGNDTLYYSLGVMSFMLTLFLIWRLKKILDKQQPIPQFSLE
ncbi:CPBP family intramembrane metalloprotease [Rhodocytophaga rosea]|uniref:CPBP family intramembrane metalloprotease n=1 Tax=Rhodocytophaga rosea TaxID=2704465 RepID=A0A6C0GNY9_9BACT|nr:type II CAAX endopeptidase family protein [Rhodocytophaga rosea]QHT69340.1 CPBP family intramembrane metalloprotease [Rhodocytophaga rosea]